MPKVYIPQEPMILSAERQWVRKRIDLVPATRFGELIVVFGPDASIIDRSLIQNTAKQNARLYDPKVDYVLALGSPTLIAMFAWAIGQEDKKLRILEWSKRDQCYYPTMSEVVR